MTSIRDPLARTLGIADLPTDTDEARLRKRVGVAAGYATILAPVGLPLLVNGSAIGWGLAVALSISSIANLVMLARWRRFERYVFFLIGCGPVFVILANVLSGGVTTGGAGLAWAFLVPSYALLALGPNRATRWFFVFLGTVLLAVAIDPIVRTVFAPPPYAVQLLLYVQNLVLPLAITFVLLRYVDIRRREA